MNKNIQKMMTLPANQTARTIIAKEGAKLVGQVATKAVAKTVATTVANPAMLVADGVEIVGEHVLHRAGMDRDDAKKVAAAGGLATSVGIGAAVGGPVGAAAGAAVWGVGKAISWMFE